MESPVIAPEVIVNEARILEAIERADLDPAQQEKLEQEFAKEIHLLTAAIPYFRSYILTKTNRFTAPAAISSKNSRIRLPA